jgi:hypothetical protein
MRMLLVTDGGRMEEGAEASKIPSPCCGCCGCGRRPLQESQARAVPARTRHATTTPASAAAADAVDGSKAKTALVEWQMRAAAASFQMGPVRCSPWFFDS